MLGGFDPFCTSVTLVTLEVTAVCDESCFELPEWRELLDRDPKLLPGTTGEIYVKSKVLFEGYTSGESRDQREGYMAVGDLGHLDEEGYLFVEARSDEMVVVGGENVYPIEVEQVIEDIGGVEEVTVFGVDDEEYGKVLVAFVVGTVDADQIEKVCRSELASYKVPRRIKVVDELPCTSTGKVLKRELIQAARD